MASSENFDPGRIRSARDKVYGIAMTLAESDPISAVLGDDWQTVRWYATEAERDSAYDDVRKQHVWSRKGDRPTLRYSKIESQKPNAPMLPRPR